MRIFVHHLEKFQRMKTAMQLRRDAVHSAGLPLEDAVQALMLLDNAEENVWAVSRCKLGY